jgi:tetratricopeptide (TPR) repeat protein
MLPSLFLAAVLAAGDAPGAGPCRLPSATGDARIPGATLEDLARQAADAEDGGRADDAARFYRAAVELDPRWHDGWWRLALVLVDASCLDAAENAVRHVVRLNPLAGPGWALSGVIAFRLGHYDRARPLLERGLAQGATAAPEVGRWALHALTLLLIRGGDFTSPTKNLALLARLEPGDAEVPLACGLLALRMPRLPVEVPAADREAVAAAGQAAYAGLAGRNDEARKGFADLVVKFPTTRGVHFAYGLVLSRDGSAEALALFRREVELFPDHGEAQQELALEMLERGDARQAIGPAREAARLRPDSAWSRLALGRALLAQDAVAEATGELEHAERLGPGLREVYVALAQAYARAGRTDDVARVRQALQRLDARQRPGRP